MGDDPSFAQYEQSIIDNEIKRTERAERLRRSHEIADASDDRVRDSRHRLRISFDDVICRSKAGIR